MALPECGVEPPFYGQPISGIPDGKLHSNLDHLTWQSCINDRVSQLRAQYGYERVNPDGTLKPEQAPVDYPPLVPSPGPTAFETFWHNYGAIVILGIIGTALLIIVAVVVILAKPRQRRSQQVILEEQTLESPAKAREKKKKKKKKKKETTPIVEMETVEMEAGAQSATAAKAGA